MEQFARSIYILFFQMGYIQLFSEYIPMILAITISVYSLSQRSVWCVFFSNDSILFFAKGYRREGLSVWCVSVSINSICFFLSCRTYTSLPRRKYTPKKLSTEPRETSGHTKFRRTVEYEKCTATRGRKREVQR